MARGQSWGQYFLSLHLALEPRLPSRCPCSWPAGQHCSSQPLLRALQAPLCPCAHQCSRLSPVPTAPQAPARSRRSPSLWHYQTGQPSSHWPEGMSSPSPTLGWDKRAKAPPAMAHGLVSAPLIELQCSHIRKDPERVTGRGRTCPASP